jgi:multidrug efflux pump subunit AcrA (membrane-fusion protein)
LRFLSYVALRSGPLAPIPVTVTTAESRSIAPALFGIGTVEARYTYRIGPTVAGRIKRVDVQVGDRVQAGQLLGEMDPVDLDDRIASQEAALKRAESVALAAEAQVREALARKTYAEKQASRHEQLLQARSVSEETVEGKHQELQVTEAGFVATRANLGAARQELARIRSDLDGLIQQRVSIARALVNRPPVILANEPIASLDSERALAVIRILNQMARQYETAIIVVTHDEKIIPTFKRIYHIRDGKTQEEAGEGRAFDRMQQNASVFL